jgi:hypothetical protein
MYLPDSRFETPGLLTPGQKPVGGVKIDWNNPLTRGLTHYYLTDSVYIFVDLVPNRPADVAIVGSGHTAQGGMVTTSGSSSQYIQLPVLNITSFANIGFIVGEKRLSGVVDWSFLRSTTTAWTGFYQEGGMWKSTNNNSFDGLVDPVSGGAQGSQDVDFYSASFSPGNFSASKNGGVVFTDSSVSTPVWSTDAKWLFLGVSYRNSGAANESVTNFTYFGVYNRSLTQNELALLSANPYQFLIPA